MAKSIARLIRDPKIAETALKELQDHGFNHSKVGFLARQGDAASKLLAHLKGAATAQATLPEVGTAVGAGPLAAALKESDPGAAIIKALEITPEAWEYYRFGLVAGGILLAVQGEEAKLTEARTILKKAELRPAVMHAGANSPGFATADRMSATNPIDAPMSGDFRKY